MDPNSTIQFRHQRKESWKHNRYLQRMYFSVQILNDCQCLVGKDDPVMFHSGGVEYGKCPQDCTVAFVVFSSVVFVVQLCYATTIVGSTLLLIRYGNKPCRVCNAKWILKFQRKVFELRRSDFFVEGECYSANKSGEATNTAVVALPTVGIIAE